MLDYSSTTNQMTALDTADIIMDDNSFVGGILEAFNSSTITMRGNSSVAGGIVAFDNATVNMYVQEFTYDNTTYAGNGNIYSITDLIPVSTWRAFSGVMEGGDSFNTSLRVGSDPTQIGEIYMHIVPEPMSMSLLALGGIAAIKRRRIRKGDILLYC